MKILAKKIMMSSYLNKNKYVPITIFHYEDPIVYKIENSSNYSLCTFSFFKEENTKLPRQHIGMYKKHSIDVHKSMLTFKTKDIDTIEYLSSSIHKIIDLSKFIKTGSKVNVTCIIKGRGFTGAMVLHNFKGQPASHGVTRSHRSLGSTGSKKVSRVFPGKKMHGRMGGYNVFVKNLTILYFDPIRKIIAFKGCTPGHYNSIAKIELI